MEKFGLTIPDDVKAIVLVRKGIAKRNFLKHAAEANISKIKAQIKRGSVKIENLKNATENN